MRIARRRSRSPWKDRSTGAWRAMTAAPRISAAAFTATSRVRRCSRSRRSTPPSDPFCVSTPTGRVTDISVAAPRLSLAGTSDAEAIASEGPLRPSSFAAQPEASFDVQAAVLDVDEIMAAAARFQVAAIARPPSGSFPRRTPRRPPRQPAVPSFARMLAGVRRSVRADRCVARGLELTNLSTARDFRARRRGAARHLAYALYGGTARGHADASALRAEDPVLPRADGGGISIRPLIAALGPERRPERSMGEPRWTSG